MFFPAVIQLTTAERRTGTDAAMSFLVSVIIPCKDGAAWLAEAIESCLQQTWQDLEIIVVDNGSSDASRDIAWRYGPLTLLECARDGASAARNTGLERARGAFIQFLDADDVLDRDKIRLQMERLADAPQSSLASCAWARFRDRPSQAVFSPEPVWRDLAPEEFLISSWLGGGMMPSFAWLTPRALIDAAGPWNEDLSVNDDGEYFCRVVLASSGIVFCNEARGYYRTATKSSLSRRRDLRAFLSAFEAARLSSERLLARTKSPPAAKACATQFQRFIYDAFPDVPDLITAAERRVSELGGHDLKLEGGRVFRILSGCFGWKTAKRWQLAGRRVKEWIP
jgi:glycosyltransferase involved in cell wall biosynthesis